MVAAVQLASMEATYTGMMKTAAAIPEFIIAAEVMVMLMNRCFFSKKGIFFLPLWWYLLEGARECATLGSFFIHFDDEDSCNANLCSGNRPQGPCNHNHELYISAIIVPVKKFKKLLDLFDSTL